MKKIYWIFLAAFHVTVIIQTGQSCTVDITPKVVFVLLNQTITLNCTSSCPQPPELESRLLKKNTNKTIDGLSAELIVDDWEESKIKCLAYPDASEPVSSIAIVNAYALPSRVDIDMEDKMVEGYEYNVTCTVHDVAPVKFVTVSLTRGEEIIFNQTYKEDKHIGKQTLTEIFRYSVTRDDNQQEFRCQVMMNLTGIDNTTVQSSPVQRSVSYPTEFVSCSESVVWLENKTFELICTAIGNPAPTVQCSSNGRTLQPQQAYQARREMSGVYTCVASNMLNSVNRSVQVVVQYPPGTPTVTSSANSTVSRGASFNISCYSDALPPPVYTWNIPSQAAVTYSSDRSTIFVEEASSSHNGTYTCEATNEHGRSVAEQLVEAEKEGRVPLWVIILPIVIAVLLVISACIIYCLCNKGKKGVYDLLNRKRGGNPEVAHPLKEKSPA